jgi:hypothetical protein
VSLTVPIPMPMPQHVMVTWTSTGAACIVWCAKCNLGTSLYTTVLRRDPDALVKAVEEHRRCER